MNITQKIPQPQNKAYTTNYDNIIKDVYASSNQLVQKVCGPLRNCVSS